MSRFGYRRKIPAADTNVGEDAFASDIGMLSEVRTRNLSLPPHIMAAYLEQSWSSRRKMNIGWMGWAAGLSILCGLIESLVIPEGALAGVVIGRGVITAALVLGALAIRMAPRSGVEGLVTIAACLGVVAGSAVMAAHVGPQAAERYLVQATFLCGTAIAVSCIAWRDTLVLAAATMTALAASMAVVAQPTVSTAEMVQIAAFYSAGVAGLVLAKRSMNKVLYRIYVLGVKDRLKMSAIERANDTLYAIARTDQLTQIANRRHFDEMFEALRARAEGRVAMFMIDIDHFKRLNDALGHAAGDECLKAVAGIIRSELRLGQDFLARFGGEEFVAVLTNIECDEALAIAGRVRRAIEARGMPNPSAERGVVTASVGVSVSPPARAEHMVALADAALYEAKSSGRNAVRIASVAAALQVA